MNQIGHVCLVFFGAVLQAVTVEAKRGGGGGGKGKKGGGGGGGGGSTSGTTIGVVAGAVVAIILLAVAIEKFRSRVTRFFEPRSCPQDDKPRTNKLKKRPDLERNTMQGYQPQDPPVYTPSPPPPFQHNQMDWRRDSYSGPTPHQQIQPGLPSFPPIPYMGAAYTPSQYSPGQPFPSPHLPPMPYPPVPPTPGYGR